MIVGEAGTGSNASFGQDTLPWLQSRFRSGFVILEVSRNPASLLHALTGNITLQAVRRALEAAGFDFSCQSGAVMLVKPDQYQAVDFLVRRWDLQKRHIIISPDFEATVRQAIASVPKADKVRVKSCRRVLGRELHAREQRITIGYKSTFVDVADMGSQGSWPGSTRTQSTTDACQRKRHNPRRG